MANQKLDTTVLQKTVLSKDELNRIETIRLNNGFFY